ncbi:MATE family efflux transporter [Ignisphaera sp. 4213-co]|uniref:MATE family efflux transporter n=1 Tax=Ignisphaera cupida TaxID=3050454 RepID=A0ABD4ZAY1_9CREN|nr:MATE family efflux transporter [Ignisphaera sp. 4213-co]MDK6029258.1 MATE family efflux transporter [Ignisphaera sp. 4213-co]
MSRLGRGFFNEYRDRILNGSTTKTLLWLGLPIIMVQLVNISYNIVDAFWLSQYSPIFVSVPRQIWPTVMLFQALAMALGAANQALISQYVGAEMYDEAAEAVKQYITVSTSFGIFFGLAYYLLRPLMFGTVTSVPQELYDAVMQYSGIIAFDLSASYFVLCFSTILQSIGDTRTPSIVNAVSALLNVVLDPLMIMGMWIFPRMGVAGAAIATVLSRAVGGAILVYATTKRFPFIKKMFTRDIDSFWLKSVIRIGTPVLAMNILNSLAFTFQLRLINMFGVVAASAWGIGFTVIDVADAALFGLTQATAIAVGQCLGAEKIDKAKHYAKMSILVVASSVAVGALVVYNIRRGIISLFLTLEDPVSSNIYRETENFLTYALSTLPFFGLFFVGMSVGRGSGHTLYPTIIGIVRLWAIRILLGYILSQYMGSTGIWIAFALSNIFSGIASVAWVSKGSWTKPVIRKHELM